MKYFSEKLNKTFDTVRELEEAEKCLRKKNAQVSKNKKDLADKIDKIDSEINTAYKEYDMLRRDANDILKASEEEATKIIEEANKKVDNLLKPQSDKITDLKAQKRKLVSEFINKFGTYTKYYKGNDAIREAEKIDNLIDTLFNWPRIFKF